MDNEKLINIIEYINSGGWEEYSSFFGGSWEVYLNFISKRGLLDMVDPLSDGLSENSNAVLLFLLNNDYEKWSRYIVEKLLNDVEYIDGNYYLELKDLEDLSVLFRDSRNSSTRWMAEKVLGANDEYEYYHLSYREFEPCRDFIDDLTKENKERFLNKMFSLLENEKVENGTELLDDYADENDDVLITSENWQTLKKDDSTLDFLLQEVLTDLNIDIFSMYDNCYNDAYAGEIYDSVWGEIELLFEKPKWIKRVYRNIKTDFAILKIKDLKYILESFLEANYKYGGSNSIYYIGSLIGIIKECMEDGSIQFFDFSVGDYPDFRRVSECINSNVYDIV